MLLQRCMYWAVCGLLAFSVSVAAYAQAKTQSSGVGVLETTGKKGIGSELVKFQGKTLPIAEVYAVVSALPLAQKNQIINEMDDALFNAYDRYLDQIKEGTGKEIQEKKANLEALKKRGHELEALLRAKTENYISLAEQGKLIPDRKYIVENILDNPLFDDSLKQRARKFVN